MLAMRACPRVVCVALLLSTTNALAQNPEVEALLRHGVELRQRGLDAQALTEFQRALRLSPTPRVLAQVALAEQASGRWVDASTHLEQVLAATADPWITRNRQALDAARAIIEQHVGSVMVTSNVSGPRVTIAGSDVGALPLQSPVRMEVGEVEIRVTPAGRGPITRRVTVTPGETARVEIVVSPSAPEAVQRVATTPAVVDASHSGTAQRALGWVSLVAGAIGVGVGVGGSLMRQSAVEHYNPLAVCPGTDVYYANNNVCLDYIDQFDMGRNLQYGGFIAGGALALTGIILLATAPSGSRSTRQQTSVRCMGGPGAIGATCGVTF